MKVGKWIRSRPVTNRVRWAIDNLLPPVLSDARWFNRLLADAMFGRGRFDLDFREKILSMSAEELAEHFAGVEDSAVYRESDTTPRQMDFVCDHVVGESILEIGCGNGALATRLAEAGHRVTACDLKSRWLERLGAAARDRNLSLATREASATALPFPDASFDTVVSTHTLEHIPALGDAVRELCRVASRRVLIVVPRQKYKRYTIDTHVHFFPTEARLLWLLDLPEARVESIDGDWALVWDVPAASSEKGRAAAAR